MFTEQAVVHASQSLTSLTLNTNTTQSPNQNVTPQSLYQQTKQQKPEEDKYNRHYHQQQHHHHHSPHHHHSLGSQQNAQPYSSHLQQHNHNYHYTNKQHHTLPSSLPTSMESSISRRDSIIEHCSCGLTFKVDKNTNNIITSSTSLLTLNTIYNENPSLIDQTNNQGYLTQSQNILQDSKHHQQHQREKQTQHQPQQQHQTPNKYSHPQHHAHHCHYHQTPTTGGGVSSTTASAPVTIPRYKPSEPPEIHTHEYFSQESQTQDHTTTITNTTASSGSSLNAFGTTTPHSHGCRHSHVHAQTDFSYGHR